MKKMGNSSNNNIHSVLWKIAAVVWAGLIFNLSTSTYGPSFSMGLVRGVLDYFHLAMSQVNLNAIHHLLRKLAHPAEYAIFAMLIYGSSSEPQPFAWRPRRALWCLLIAAAYSLTDEFHQRFVPGRTPALADCGIDSLGGVLGMFIYYLDDLVSQGFRNRPALSPVGRSGIVRRLSSKFRFAARWTAQ